MRKSCSSISEMPAGAGINLTPAFLLTQPLPHGELSQATIGKTMKTLNTELLSHIYENADKPLSNDELYKRVQQETGLSDAHLNEMREFGTGKTKTSAIKHKVRWYQQTLRQAGVIERVPENRGVWRYAIKTEKKLHEARDSLYVVGFSTDLGVAIFGDARQVFSSIDEPITLCITSPPYMLRRARRYGAGFSGGEQGYIDFIVETLEPVVKSLERGGSIVINVTQDAHLPGRPSRSLYVERLTLALAEKLGLELMDRLIWSNRAKPPAPTQWACKERVQLATSYEPILWFTNDALHVKSDNRRVLQPHTEQHLKLLQSGGELRSTNYGDGAYRLKPGSYGKMTEGSIAKNCLQYGNACADTRLCHAVSVELGLPKHGASFPSRLAQFFVEFLSQPDDLIVDPFAGLHKVPLAAERLGRRWMATDKVLEWMAIAKSLFAQAPGYSHNPLLDALVQDYRKPV